ncbi:Helix-turn-helix motif [Pseudomonas chlororaphis subsp. aurantiaca]|jgi:HTH-type transcriptional regulator/antitoxin HigA|uniref:helix-turn-helix domain-containing protein n=1 Tax=Pseudomonas chlororaphis TaxID=587753 RepID=UPI00087A7BE2|nr:transcriptional regulator [Pseudomonas chlororaphis]AZD19833.1 Helix-turn-helix motif [Pseudomonas chlororaphis subsp. aurantiaca]AZD33279.1 Helix-turn-helix motif [Pseudomonas chlororaphis subsp. aurantiaca]AZD39611.1 Helix-turn-helix motif [Pseudomonas chlororaphis subsp. aurantiaca]AZD64423.1 Helix-turn-helix motif [Pseudomonas chlororaphis subsp. aurantiaca]AZD70893.1 Helix-turn-helix motif [Pseudomonas chlororaphis subsp. aurantiaca]
MSALIEQVAEHWQFVAPLLRKPKTEADYDRLVQALDELLDLTGEDEAHPLNSLVDIIGDWIEAYDLEHRPMPVASGVDVLRYMMREHGLTQSDLPGVGAQSVVSEILSGKRQLNLRQVRWLAARFKVSMETFI